MYKNPQNFLIYFIFWWRELELLNWELDLKPSYPNLMPISINVNPSSKKSTLLLYHKKILKAEGVCSHTGWRWKICAVTSPINPCFLKQSILMLGKQATSFVYGCVPCLSLLLKCWSSWGVGGQERTCAKLVHIPKHPVLSWESGSLSELYIPSWFSVNGGGGQ